MTDPHVIIHLQPPHPDDQIEVADLYVVSNFTVADVDDSDANSHPLADAITEKTAIHRAVNERGQKGDTRQQFQWEFTKALHSQVSLPFDRSAPDSNLARGCRLDPI